MPLLQCVLCCEQGMAGAIHRWRGRVEAGAQGQHQVASGYLPCAVFSADHLAAKALRGAVARFLQEKMRAVRGEMDWMAEEYSPFRKVAG